jgi:hypothetical protein
MTGRHIPFLPVALVALISFGHLKAEAKADSRARAAAVLFQQFETVGYSSSDVLSRFDNPGLSEPNNKLNLSLPLTLRLPFVQLIGGLRIIGPNSMTDLRQNYSGVLVGAKDFAPPDGIGMVSSQECYVGILRPNGRSIIESDFRSSMYESIDGNHVWTWSAPPYEGYPRSTTFYIAEIENTYFVMANNLAEFRETVRKLRTVNSEGESKVGDLKQPIDDDYWIHRSIRDTDATVPAQHTPNAVVMRFVADVATMKGHIEVDSSDSSFKANLKGLPASEVVHYEPAGNGIWQATIPLSKDPATTTALFRVFSFFGFGVVL